MTRLLKRLIATQFMLAILVSSAMATSPWEATDLNPVQFKGASTHEPIVLVEGGQPLASIVVMNKAAGARELQSFIKQATGAELPIMQDKIVTPAIVLGDCPEAAKLGLDSARMPPEGFAVKTTADAVFIVGRNMGRDANGGLWGAYEFLERFVGVRWYFPQAVEDGPQIGQSIPKARELVVPPVWLEDAPAFRMRVMWPPMSQPWQGKGIKLTGVQGFLRSGNSWPNRLKVHQPNWAGYDQLKKNRPEVFQQRKDGSRQHEVLCYGNPKTVETYLDGVQNFVDGKQPLYAPIAGKAITVSPHDVELACYCKHCRELWDADAGQYGGASKVMATFVDKLAREVKRRWPDEGFTIVYLPYLNYTTAPRGFRFPGNVEVQLAGMPGMASYKEPLIRDAEQANIDRWIATTGRPIQNWHYSAWPAHKTKANYQYPHVLKEFYQRNRDKTIGSFINGTHNHWPRQNISLYCWLKVLWNPEFDVDAASDEFARRMFGPSSGPMRELLALEMNSWEMSRWPGGRFSPKGIYEASFPAAKVERMKQLLAQARDQAQNDSLALARVEYCAPSLEAFFKESDTMSGSGFRPLAAQKVGELPSLDGKLDDPQWKRASANSFVQATGKAKGKPAQYPTEVKAVWTFEGVTFGFHMHEPTPQLLETVNGGHDNGQMWWDDNVEIFLDVTGASEGEFYQFIVNPDICIWDSKLKDTTWECNGFEAAAHRGKDFWSLDVYLPFSAFPEAKKPGSGTNTIWTGNFTRHRVADKGLKSKKPQQVGSVREYQRMNTTGSATSDNLADFAEIQFIE
ncbi:MAG: DUF4838 domain-containing protein [Pirellulaceae bacterium]|nr:DUF4838 domain-containing protein [Pirellulaceae bacterium]